MKNTVGLVHIGRDTFLMTNPTEVIKNKHVISTVFTNYKDAMLDIDVFEYFGLPVHIIEEKIDKRTAKYKSYLKTHQFFTVYYLPKIKERFLGKSTRPHIYSLK